MAAHFSPKDQEGIRPRVLGRGGRQCPVLSSWWKEPFQRSQVPGVAYCHLFSPAQLTSGDFCPCFSPSQ